MIEEILNTEVKVKILKFLSDYPDKQFQASDISRKLNFSVSRTSECLKELAGKGILESRKIGKGYLFKVNKSNYITKIIFDMFRKEKKIVDLIANDFVSRVKGLVNVASIILFGSATRGLKFGSDIDFLIVTEDEIETSVISNVEAELIEKYGFPVSSVFMTVSELKRKTGEEFVINIIANGKIVFGDSLEDLIYGKKNKERRN